jgi:hypothetical protein
VLNSNATGPAASAPDAWTWIGSDTPRVIVGGQSHRMALVHAVRAGEVGAPVAVLTNRDAPLETNNAYWDKVAEVPIEVPIAIPWVGNEMNANFLLEHEIPFRVFGTGGTDTDETLLVPEEMLKAFVLNKLERSGLEIVLRRLVPREIVFLDPPPPKPDETIRSRWRSEPFLIATLRSRGLSPDDADITPFAFRLALWKIRRSAFADVAERFGIPVIGVPDEAVDEKGGLRDEFSGSDSTHAGGGYGALVWRQILDHFNVEALPVPAS